MAPSPYVNQALVAHPEDEFAPVLVGDLADLPLLRIVKCVIQRLLVKLLGADGIARIAVQKRLNHASFRVLPIGTV